MKLVLRPDESKVIISLSSGQDAGMILDGKPIKEMRPVGACQFTHSMLLIDGSLYVIRGASIFGGFSAFIHVQKVLDTELADK